METLQEERGAYEGCCYGQALRGAIDCASEWHGIADDLDSHGSAS